MPLQSESPTILAARAILYGWLRQKFDPSAVAIEKEVGHDYIPRWVDCWVETGSLKIAYWLVEAQLKPVQRAVLEAGFEELGVQVNWLFLTNMLG